MTATPTEHRAKIAEARNVLGEVIARARFAGEPTILVNRGKEAAVIVNHAFYEQAKKDRALIELLKERAEEGRAGNTADARIKGDALYVALASAERDLDD
ncbi:type II toxin-antitoxin system prevent-host-death family antitoxin [Streptomyces sp. NPDC057052]|uniref:type II toxin-antitoxin system prevent-host-death family antitoxin n=1 Tax=Streptomyces sp. NPDC057052 TaxID=3346010 RepID=UPI003631E5AA